MYSILYIDPRGVIVTFRSIIRVAQNEEILENVTSMGGLRFILMQIVQCNIFFEIW